MHYIPQAREGGLSEERNQVPCCQAEQFLRDDWIRQLAHWKHYWEIFVDDPTANERTKDREHGWAPTGVCPNEHRPHK